MKNLSSSSVSCFYNSSVFDCNYIKLKKTFFLFIAILDFSSETHFFQCFIGMCICHFVKRRRIALKEIVFLPPIHDAHFSSRLSQNTKQRIAKKKKCFIENKFGDIEIFWFKKNLKKNWIVLYALHFISFLNTLNLDFTNLFLQSVVVIRLFSIMFFVSKTLYASKTFIYFK